jgi:hypothetical protein
VAETTWTLTRNGERVRVDLHNAFGITAADTIAISKALEEYLSDDEITVVQVDGPVLMESEMPPGLGSAMRELGDLARSRGKRFDVGPI